MNLTLNDLDLSSFPRFNSPGLTDMEVAALREPASPLLPTHFRFVHEPLRASDSALPLLGNRDCIDKLKKRLWNSRGGAFLVTGFRGAGKSTVVHRALDELTSEREACTFVPLFLNVAHPVTSSQLLFEMVRRLFDELSRRELLDRLPVDTVGKLLLAYRRTSLSMKDSRSSTVEQSGTFGTSAKAVPLAGWLGASVRWSRKSVRVAATEATFLAYSDADVEYDFIHIVRLLTAPAAPLAKVSLWQRFWRRFAKSRVALPPVRLVIVLDELDKLTSSDDGRAAFDVLLSGLKNLLIVAGVHFVLVGGADLYDRWVRDARRGNGLFESVFAWHLYVPCLWTSPQLLLNEYGWSVADSALEGYLGFKARGIPRRLVQEFNLCVTWVGSRARIRGNTDDQELWRFYAHLNRQLTQFFSASAATDVGSTPFDVDRRQLGAFYVLDWILGSAGRHFSIEETARLTTSGDLDSLLQLSVGRIEKLVAHFVRAGIVEAVPPASARDTVIGDAQVDGEPRFRLVEDVLNRVLGIAQRNEGERSQLVITGIESHAVEVPDAVPDLGGRYTSLRLLGAGGMGAVYLGFDVTLQRQVAIKVLHSTASLQAPMVTRFQREADLLRSVSHPNIVVCYAFEKHGTSQALVMEFVSGELLSSRLQKRLSLAEAMAIGLHLAEAVAYLAEHGICRIDLKPDNVILNPQRGPVLIDLGIARFVGEQERNLIQTRDGIFIGTPQYTSPEQISHEWDVDPRSDVFVFALLLVELVTGHPVVEGGTVAEALSRVLAGNFGLEAMPVSPELRGVLKQALQIDRNLRQASPRILLNELRQTPEARLARQVKPGALAS